MTACSTISPADLGLPAKFSSWRPGQFESVETIVSADQRFIGLAQPTGAGKSASSIASCILNGGRAVVLTSTKALQDQYQDDFFSCGMSEIRGRANYRCLQDREQSCAEGSLLDCKDTSCPYKQAKQSFITSRLGNTNYSYALSSNLHSEGIGDVDILIMDEAHNASSELCSALEIRLDHGVYRHVYSDLNLTPPLHSNLAQWKKWSSDAAPKVKTHFEQLKKSGKTKGIGTVNRLHGDLSRISTVTENWILDEDTPGVTIITPLWPTEYAEKLLFKGIKKVVLVSATIVPKSLSVLGIEDTDSLFLETQYQFDASRCPVYLFGSSRIDHRSTPAQLQEQLSRADSLISRRLDRKGLIHTVSYDRQRRVINESEYAGIMFSPRGDSLNSTIRNFRYSNPPRLLVSPSITTGYDFPMRDAEYQLILKVPFIDGRSPIMKARTASDPEYLPYLTAQILTQTCGRIMRSPEDQGETFILDSHANWFFAKSTAGKYGDSRRSGGYRHLFPSWFVQLVRYPNGQPLPPPPLPY